MMETLRRWIPVLWLVLILLLLAASLFTADFVNTRLCAPKDTKPFQSAHIAADESSSPAPYIS